jgi:hypothetical protein
MRKALALAPTGSSVAVSTFDPTPALADGEGNGDGR